MRLSRETLVTATLRLLAPLFVGAAVIGGIRNYSMVPFWDMWNGYLYFFFRVIDGHWGAWWDLHNEHRIVLSRMLFWIDLAWLNGTVWFLLVANYLLVVGAFMTFRAILRDRAGRLAGTKPAVLASLFVWISLFSWVQRENFIWGFQSQFFLAQWLPLLAFYLLHRSTTAGPAATRQFALACVVGVLCVGSMASGVMALPLMVAFALLQRMGWTRVATLALLSVICLTAYLIDYTSPPGHGYVGHLTQLPPVRLLQYVALYLGSPFYHFLGARSLPVGQLFGLAFIVASAAKAVQCLRRPRQHALELSLLAYVAYIGGTALGTGIGRLTFGLTQATESRYTTPALMGWMALTMLFLPSLLRSLGAWQHRIVWPLLALLCLMSVPQAKALRSERAKLFEWDVAALALELGVHDDRQVRWVFFSTDAGLQISKSAAQANVSVFGRPPIRDAGRRINRPAADVPTAACGGALTEVAEVEGDPRYRRVAGWIAPATGADRIAALDLVDEQGIVVGYALAGEDVAPAGADAAVVVSGRERPFPPGQVFKGYLLSDHASKPLTLAPIGAGCSIRVVPPLPPAFHIRPAGPSAPAVTVSVRNILSNNGWTGTDFARSQVAGWKTIGSYVDGDSDTGNLVLRLRRGDAIYYRSGPNNENQQFRVDDGGLYAGRLPVTEAWAVLVFDSPSLPEKFTLTLSDAGSGWGEWSAIALRDAP
jgi:hypothetical protein